MWDVQTQRLLNSLDLHGSGVYYLHFASGTMVTRSTYRSDSIVVWDLVSPKEIPLCHVLDAKMLFPVTVMDFDVRYTVAASSLPLTNPPMRLWCNLTGNLVRTLYRHRFVTCLQYRDRLLMSGSWDTTIRVWDTKCGTRRRVLENQRPVMLIRFDTKRIVSYSYDK